MKKLLISQKNSHKEKLWADIKIKDRSFWVMIDSGAEENFLHKYVINELKIQTWSQTPFWLLQTDDMYSN